MKVLTYDDMHLEPISYSYKPSECMKLACDITQKKLKKTHGISLDTPISDKLAQFLIDADHTSVFEHSSMTFLASGISRSLLAQVTRQRMFSFTSASQHYQDYRDYPMSIRPGYTKDKALVLKYEKALDDSLNAYIELIELGEKPEEARQVLPNACTVNLVITANARSLAEFLTTRLCERNTLEMRIFAQKLHTVCQNWIPEVFSFIGPYCFMDGGCNQGPMSCRK